MTNENACPEGYSWLSPYLTVADVLATVALYEQAFGMQRIDVANDPEGVAIHAELRYKNQTLMIGREGGHGATALTPAHSKIESPIGLYFYCDNVDELCKHAKKSGITVIAEPEDMFWGDRMCRLEDKDGYCFCFATHNKNPSI